MKPEWWPGEEHEAFAEWAASNGIDTNSVTPARFQGRGLGMMATRNIKKGEVVLQVPTKLMLRVEDIPSTFIDKLPENIAVQALLAAYLTHGAPDELSKYELWRKSWPSRKDFEDSMPILWPTVLGGPQLPSSTDNDRTDSEQPSFLPRQFQGSGIQSQRLRKAWTDVISAFPDTNWETFSYNWLIVNTRSFYWIGEGQETPEDPNDAMGLVPFADYFNHADVARDVKFDENTYEFRATKDYEEGDEVFMNYGSHPNDTLLAEYGFFLDVNEADSIYLDDIIFRDIHSAGKQEDLWLNQYYGNYQVTPHGPCYRTEVAACLSYMKEEDWRNHVLEGQSQGLDESRSMATIKRWILTYAAEADATITALQKAMELNTTVQAHRSKTDMLLRRWGQIKNLCDHAAKTVSV
ncbi:hypothetical protein N7489_002791 [Penicillium chrysogenum]|uniref:uncharacterized protein n=1 Tax=Penicillium chrysogenum TaxID=5076 RepID=UPI0024DF093C|nr:uncharacterized protein N7489_002791 [Penicillium chrysogenum]KAJ5252381.1 hypothetical protein N7489_002791 [Penicillium chrysogenum]KAJ6145954.1 hypothetical protein N7497_007936 [Penicillium chrysogenum]